MESQADIDRYLEELHQHLGRTLSFPRDVRTLMEQARVRGTGDVFRDAIFHAKFVTKTRDVMNRIGREGEGFEKLSAEFQNSLEKSSTLLKTIVKESPEEIKQHFVREFFSMDQASLGNLLRLLEDLSRVKNFELDGHPAPLAAGPPRDTQEGVEAPGAHKHNTTSREELVRIRNGAALGIVLLIVLVFVDPPVMVLSWGLTVIVFLLLVYIGLSSNKLTRKTES